MKGDGARPKVRVPWIPPGRLSCRRDVSSHKCPHVLCVSVLLLINTHIHSNSLVLQLVHGTLGYWSVTTHKSADVLVSFVNSVDALNPFSFTEMHICVWVVLLESFSSGLNLFH